MITEINEAREADILRARCDYLEASKALEDYFDFLRVFDLTPNRERVESLNREIEATRRAYMEIAGVTA